MFKHVAFENIFYINKGLDYFICDVKLCYYILKNTIYLFPIYSCVPEILVLYFYKMNCLLRNKIDIFAQKFFVKGYFC